MEDILGIFVAPIMVFMVVVAPIWLVLHYRAKGRIGVGLADNERDQLQGLLQKADKMQERVGALESILDAEVPGWRNKV
ncbi:envelope stress response membrane protein PspB [Aeromonas rivuli]|jgi:phage shock protein B|uniref:Phage shock protein B n=1 Tax=Aeromonas molluscorum 848 TaxID=1268236 RepID=R1GZN2_9GAMM|nr:MULTISPECIES: envelope stress response membrane protein PspB [Aeromonas]EOD53851.1 phage shock protein B [Aeromonas molluscorum 848]MCS3454098.1 phage shock protein B [Aeromonas sp. BIGb0405]MCS3459977.1 phage shock protein B [Aeromonas sp. BIGb0445]UBO75620.1 envelope stress response membrane protein PspB [Aeromonas rivuli]